MHREHSESIVGLYERHADAYDRDRDRSLHERTWLDRFLKQVRPTGAVLDVGCGMGEPLARHVVDAGFEVVGLDASASMIARCRTRFPHAEWHLADMRAMDLGRRFDGILAWDSFFHLDAAAQRAMFARFAAHAACGAPLMFTSGPDHGYALGTYQGEPLFHASLAPAEYERLLGHHGFSVLAFRPEDPAFGGHSVWLARRDA